MIPAPAFDCHTCGRRIGKTRSHWLIGEHVWCVRCVERSGVYDDASAHGSRAGIAAVLGIWPTPQPEGTTP